MVGFRSIFAGRLLIKTYKIIFNLAKSKRLLLQETWALYLVCKSLTITHYEKDLTTNVIQQLRVSTTKSQAC